MKKAAALALLAIGCSVALAPRAGRAYPPVDQQRLVEATAALQDGLISASGDQAAAGSALDHYRAFLKANQGHAYKDLEVRIESLQVTGAGVVLTMDIPTPNRSSDTARLVLINSQHPRLLTEADTRLLGSIKAGSRLKVDGEILGLLRATLANPTVAQLEFRFDRFKPQP